MTGSFDTVVIGGGVIGLAIAWRAAQQGLTVAVVDPAPGHGASRVAAGMLAPVTEVHYGEQPLLGLTLRSAQRYPSFVAELEETTGRDVAYRQCGMLAVALDAGDRAVLDDLREFQQSLGLEVAAASARECRRLEPWLSPSVHGGLVVTGDHQVDPRRLTAALLDAAGQAGVRIVRQAAAELVVEHDTATGVRPADGQMLAAGTVVLAAGARSGQVAGLPDPARPPVRPVKGQVVRLRVPEAFRPFLSRSVRGVVRGSAVYLVPREDGELVVGATQEEQGFDEEVTAGAVYELLRDARSLVPAITELVLAEASAGLRPGTPDNGPLVGPGALPGLVIATGHHRNGILQAPVTADAVADLLASGTLPEYMTPFSPLRFAPDEVAT
jgi:glycine oxidase